MLVPTTRYEGHKTIVERIDAMFEYDLFLSYAAPDTNAALSLKKRAEDKGLRVFVAKSELRPGDRWEENIRCALLRCREIAVLLTPTSLAREWVISEWSCGWLLKKAVTAIVKDLTDLGQLPERLRDFQIADYYNCDEFLEAVISRKNSDPISDGSMAIYRHLASKAGVIETLLAPELGSSPFVFKDQLGLATKQIFVAGQNLYGLTVLYGEDNERLLFEQYLVREDKPAAQFMVCDPRCREPVETWTWVNKGDYERDLWVSIVFLKEWLKRAKEACVKLTAKVVYFVPVSMTFVDPEPLPDQPPSGKLFLTPNVFEPESKARSCVFVYAPLHPGSFTKYWGNYKTTFSRGTDLSAIEVPAKYEELAERIRQERTHK
jgi:hypothetical protein